VVGERKLYTSGLDRRPTQPRTGNRARALTTSGLAPSACDDDAEVLGVDGPGLIVRQGAGGVGGDADGAIAEVGIEDVCAVTGGGHPGGDDGAGRGLREGAPADVLTDFVADLRVVDVAGGAHAHDGGFALRADVCEVVLGGHALAVGLGGLLESRIGRQRVLAVGRAFMVDEAEDRGANQLDVVLLGREVRVRAGSVTGARAGSRRLLAVAGARARAGPGARAARRGWLGRGFFGGIGLVMCRGAGLLTARSARLLVAACVKAAGPARGCGVVPLRARAGAPGAARRVVGAALGLGLGLLVEGLDLHRARSGMGTERRWNAGARAEAERAECYDGAPISHVLAISARSGRSASAGAQIGQVGWGRFAPERRPVGAVGSESVGASEDLAHDLV